MINGATVLLYCTHSDPPLLGLPVAAKVVHEVIIKEDNATSAVVKFVPHTCAKKGTNAEIKAKISNAEGILFQKGLSWVEEW